MDCPEEVIVRPTTGPLEDGVTVSSNVGFNELWKLSPELEDDPLLRQPPVYGGFRAWQKTLACPRQLKPCPLETRNWVGSHDHGRRSIAKQRSSHQIVWAVGAWRPVSET